MTERNFLCKCTFCLNENINGKILNQNTFNYHCIRIQEFSERDDENMYIEENIHLDMEENIHLDMEEEQIEKNIDDDSDTESFNFNKEDIEYYSDYNNDDDNNNDNNDNNNKSDDDDESDDDKSDDDKSDDDENMQIDDETNIPNKKIIEGLKLLYLKSLYNFTESAYDDIMKIFTTNNLSLYKIKKYLKDITGLVPVFYDMCENSCICYTG